MYKIQKSIFGEIILRENADGSMTSIPPHLLNTDYQVYLKWVAAGNKAEVIPND